MWLIFHGVRPSIVEKDLLRLIVSFEVPSKVGTWRDGLVAEMKDSSCALHVLHKHMDIVRDRLGEGVTVSMSKTIPPHTSLRNVRGRAES